MLQVTAIAALIDNGKIWIGGDSAGVNMQNLHLVVRKDEKVFIKRDFIIGFTSSFRMGNLLRYSFEPPPQLQTMTDAEYMNTIFVNVVRDCFRAGGYMKNVEGAEGGGCFIIGYRQNLYFIDTDYQVAMPADPYIACGCGSDLCLGSLYSTTVMPPKIRIQKALEAAERFSGGVRRPFVIKSL
jgi:hypothetical protein